MNHAQIRHESEVEHVEATLRDMDGQHLIQASKEAVDVVRRYGPGSHVSRAMLWKLELINAEIKTRIDQIKKESGG